VEIAKIKSFAPRRQRQRTSDAAKRPPRRPTSQTGCQSRRSGWP
jgi:hypothetical protein